MLPSSANKGWRDFINQWLGNDRPFLGICLGMQMLFEGSEESPGFRVWENSRGSAEDFKRGKPLRSDGIRFTLKRTVMYIEESHRSKSFLFCTWFFCGDGASECVLAESEYGVTYPSIVGQGRVFGTQFHPEKSGRIGLPAITQLGGTMLTTRIIPCLDVEDGRVVKAYSF